MPESPWHMLMGRIKHGSSKQFEEASLRQPISNPPESADSDPQNTVWSHTFAEETRSHFWGTLEARAGRQDVFPVSGRDDQR